MKYNLIKCCRTCQNLNPHMEMDELEYWDLFMCKCCGREGVDDDQDECEFYNPIDIKQYIIK